MQLFFFMILLQNLQAHSQVYVNGKLLNLEKALRKQVVSVLFSTKESRKWNEMLIASIKIPEREESISSSNCPTISQMC